MTCVVPLSPMAANYMPQGTANHTMPVWRKPGTQVVTKLIMRQVKFEQQKRQPMSSISVSTVNNNTQTFFAPSTLQLSGIAAGERT